MKQHKRRRDSFVANHGTSIWGTAASRSWPGDARSYGLIVTFFGFDGIPLATT
jgi:hypothetical protein